MNSYGRKLNPTFYLDAYLLHIAFIFQKKFEEYQRTKIVEEINSAKLTYIKCNHHDYANKKAWYKPKHITEVAHKYYILFYTFIRSVIGRNIPKKETWSTDQHERLKINLNKNDTKYREKTNGTKYVLHY